LRRRKGAAPAAVKKRGKGQERKKDVAFAHLPFISDEELEVGG